MKIVLTCAFLMFSVCLGRVAQSSSDGVVVPPPPPVSYCYVDATTSCADAIVTLHLEGQLPGAELACGNCTQSETTGNWTCPNSNLVVPAVVENVNLPFARRHQELAGDGPGVGGKVGTRNGTTPVDCGSTITCTLGCVQIVVNGVSVRSCGSNPLSNNMPMLPRFADGANCQAFPNPIIVISPPPMVAVP